MDGSVLSGRSPPTEEEGGGCCWWEEGGTQRKGRKGYVFCVRIEKRKIGNREIIINGG